MMKAKVNIKIAANQKGAVMVWAVVVLLLLTILVGAVLTLSMAYYTRSVHIQESQQAYYSSKSAVDAVASILTGTETGESRDAILAQIPHYGDSVQLDNVKFNTGNYSTNPRDMGKCTVKLEHQYYQGKDTYLVTAAVTVGNQKKAISLRLGTSATEPTGGDTDTTAGSTDNNPGGSETGGGTGTNPSSGTTQPETPPSGSSPPLQQIVIGVSSGSDFGSGDNTIGFTSYGFQTDAATDLYIGDDVPKYELNITSNGNSPQIIGNVYSKAPFYIKSDYYANTHVHGNIISDQLVALSENVTVGPYPNCCAGTQRQSEIYTTASMTAVNAAKIYSKVTANTVSLGNEVTAYNTIIANTATFQDNVSVTGNVYANQLTLKGQATINGNVTAGVLVLQDNAVINGNVVAQSITINDGGKINGNVTAKSVVSSGSWKDPMITKDLNVEYAVSSNIKVGGALYTGVTFLGSSAPVSPLASRVPPAPGAPILPSSTDQPTQIYNDPNQVLGRTDGGDSYYRINGNLDVSLMTTQGEGNIYLFVPSGASFTLNEMTPVRKTNPNVFIIVESGGAFKRYNIEAESWKQKDKYKDFYGYIFGEDGSSVYVGRGTHVYGGVSKATLGIDVIVNFIPNPALKSGTAGTSTSTTTGTVAGTTGTTFGTTGAGGTGTTAPGGTATGTTAGETNATTAPPGGGETTATTSPLTILQYEPA